MQSLRCIDVRHTAFDVGTNGPQTALLPLGSHPSAPRSPALAPVPEVSPPHAIAVNAVNVANTTARRWIPTIYPPESSAATMREGGDVPRGLSSGNTTVAAFLGGRAGEAERLLLFPSVHTEAAGGVLWAPPLHMRGGRRFEFGSESGWLGAVGRARSRTAAVITSWSSGAMFDASAESEAWSSACWPAFAGAEMPG